MESSKLKVQSSKGRAFLDTEVKSDSHSPRGEVETGILAITTVKRMPKMRRAALARVSALGCKRFRPATPLLLAGVPGCADGMQARRSAAFSPLPRTWRRRTSPRAACCCSRPPGGRHAHRRSPGQRTGSHWSLHCGQRVRHPQDGANPARAGEAGACRRRLHRPSPTGPRQPKPSATVSAAVGAFPASRKPKIGKHALNQQLPKAFTNTLQDTHVHLPPEGHPKNFGLSSARPEGTWQDYGRPLYKTADPRLR